ncbi:5'-3' exonuclease H3TH domain-containing protein [Roseiconus lacunae]|uniref:5'-3' exonuclease n=1 Tax=Roseiconus lacunae TaxID=2605694 RepID=UPI00309001B8|nr:5'-3' exonuclease H3TH domain-containing protein [Stieleria sp. HD01]
MSNDKPNNGKPNWAIVDVSNWAYKLLSTQGTVDRSVRLFFRWITYLHGDTRAERIVLAFDCGSFRDRIYPLYKSGRGRKPDGWHELLDAIDNTATSEGLDVLRVENFEADDIAATVTRIARERGRRAIICTADKDARQLLHDGEVVIARSVGLSKGIEWYNAARLKLDHGLTPGQWIDYQTLIGDKVDNLPGCDGIGPETAKALLQSAGSLDNHYRQPFSAPINDRARAKLSAFHRSGLRDLMRRLVTLHDAAPLPADWLRETTPTADPELAR